MFVDLQCRGNTRFHANMAPLYLGPINEKIADKGATRRCSTCSNEFLAVHCKLRYIIACHAMKKLSENYLSFSRI